jgi:hypothetical protein
VPEEPVTGALGATGALLGAVLPVEVLGGLPSPSGVTLGAGDSSLLMDKTPVAV